jgi:transcriptional regulator with XRE-family HTH domain
MYFLLYHTTTNMTTKRRKPNEALRELRQIIGRTQGEFAAMIGASKDAVASWEIGRNQLSPPFARRIALAMGVEEAGPWSAEEQGHRMEQEDPTMCRVMRFRDDPRKSDQETLRLEAETVPIWRPGLSMRAPRGGAEA